MKIKDIENIKIACELMESGLRLPLVNSLSGIDNKRLLRGLWNEIHGCRPSPGKLPSSVVSYINDYQSAADLAGFIALYRSIYRNKINSSEYTGAVLDPSALLEAWNEFGKLGRPSIDINAGYYAVRDVMFNIVLYTPCKTCTASFIYDPAKRYTERCPYCKTLHLG